MLDSEIKECMKLYSPHSEYTCILSWQKCFSTVIGRRITTSDTEEILARFKAMAWLEPEKPKPTPQGYWNSTLSGIKRSDSVPFWKDLTK